MRQTALRPRPREIKHRWWLITFSLTSCLICMVLNHLQMISQWTVRHNVNVVLFRITMKWSRNNLLATDLLAQMADPNPWSLHPWEVTFMSSFITVQDGLTWHVSVTCIIEFWPLFFGFVCSFTRLTAIILNRHEIWISLLECLLLLFRCTTIQTPDSHIFL